LACDFFVTVTATFRLVYVFLVLDIGTRRIVHWNVTEHPTEWTVQQFRACVIGDEPYRFIVHDRDAIYSPAVDRALTSMHLRVLKTPARVPQANACCERLIGTARRECLDFVIPLNERHVQRVRPSGYLITTAVAHTPVSPRNSGTTVDRGSTINRSPASERASCCRASDSWRFPSRVSA